MHDGSTLEDCGACGASIGPTTDFPWHWPDEDCRAIRQPLRDDGARVTARLEYLRGELRAERISMSEIHELQGIGEQGLIPADDVEMREAAGLPEFPEAQNGS
jgi:hypothetical protein